MGLFKYSISETPSNEVDLKFSGFARKGKLHTKPCEMLPQQLVTNAKSIRVIRLWLLNFMPDMVSIHPVVKEEFDGGSQK